MDIRIKVSLDLDMWNVPDFDKVDVVEISRRLWREEYQGLFSTVFMAELQDRINEAIAPDSVRVTYKV